MADLTVKKHIVIGGGSGFIGRALTQVLRSRGDQVTLVSRTVGDQRVTWDQVKANGLPECDVVINLAGKHILDMRRFWTEGYRDEVLRSRIETTETLVKLINEQAKPPSLFISTAGKCFYGSQAFRQSEQYLDLDERSEPVGIDYPAKLVRLWEQAADGMTNSAVRHVKLRLGIVLASRPPGLDAGDPTGPLGAQGVFPMLHAVFKRGLGMTLGTGAQPFPWVHVDDVVGIFLRAIDNASLHGVFNVVSPGIVSNQTFAELLASKLGRSVLARVPAALIKAVVGLDRSTILLLGQRVRPTRTIEQGYQFKFPSLPECLDDLLNQTTVGSLS